MARLVGLDVNGWRDLAVRNWTEAVTGDEGPADRLIDGGTASVIVATGGLATGEERAWIGGAQAGLAPHGRGEGWGEIGRPERRARVSRLLAALVEGPPGAAEGGGERGLSAVVRSLAPQADVAVLAVPDEPRFGERAQARALAALRAAKVRQPLLAWRTVLAALVAIEDGTAAEGTRLGVVSHDAEGLALQILQVRRRPQDLVAAPERREPACRAAAPWGLAALEAAARRRALALPIERLDRVIDAARRPALAALGEPEEGELLRLDNGAWVELRLPPATPPQAVALPEDALVGCDAVILETVVVGAIREALAGALEASLGRAVRVLAPDAVVRGARLAAGRLARDEPVYFDVLPRMRTVVLVGRDPASWDLIGADEALPAGRTYRTPVPARFTWPARAAGIDVYLDREGSGRPRRARVEVEGGPDADAAVELVLEQAPAAGPARLTLSSRGWPLLRDHPRVIAFDDAQIEGQDWDEILASLRRPLPGYPERMVLPCGPGPWFGIEAASGERRGRGLAALLDDKRATWDELASRMATRAPDRDGEPPCYAVSSDGEIPDAVLAHHMGTRLEETLKARLREAKAVIELRAARVEPNTDNQALKFLTWSFRLCPKEVVNEVIEAICDRSHAFYTVPNAITLLHHALGRTAEGDNLIEAVKVLRAFPAGASNWKEYHRACAAFLLSRNDDIFDHLERSDINRMAEVVIQSLRSRPSRRELNYTAALLGGLLRWRRKWGEGYALVADDDPVATRLLEALLLAMKFWKTEHPNHNEMHDRLKDLRGYLTGEGGRPDILAAFIMDT